MIAFGHAIVLMNLDYEKNGPYQLESGVKMLNWVVAVLFIYMYFKGAKKFTDDFMKLMDDRRLNERECSEFHMKMMKAQGGICLFLGVSVFAKHC